MKSRTLYLLIGLAGFCASAAAQAQDTAPMVNGRSDDVPPDMRQAVIDHFARSFLLPALVLWDFRFLQRYPTGGTAVCGLVNYPNSTRQYVGKLPFFARFQNGRIVQAGIVSKMRVEDPVHANANAYNIACSER